MRTVDKRFITQELEQEKDIWTQLLIQRRFYYSERLIKSDERILNYLLNISALAIGALALLGSQREINRYYNIAFIDFFLSLFLSTIVLIISFFTEPKAIKKAADEELGTYERFQKSVVKILEKANLASLQEEDIINHDNLRNTIEHDIRDKKVDKFTHSFLKIMTASAVSAFFVGIISLYLYFWPKNLPW